MTWTARPSLPALHKLTATEIKAIDDEIERVGNVWVAEQAQAATTNATTTEGIGTTITFTATAGTRYKVEYDGAYQAGAIGNLIEFRLRYLAGASLVVAGSTVIRVNALQAAITGNAPFSIGGSFVPGTGQFTVGVSIRNNTGATCNLNYAASLAVGNLGLYRVT